jgi:hypothetical protein
MKAIIQKSNNRVAFLFPDSANVVITERGLIRPVHALDVTTATYKVETVTAPDFEFVGGQYSWTPEFGWAVFDSEAVSARTAEELAAAKAAKREEINRARLAANRTSFSFMGKDIAVDDVSRSDIDGVSDQVLLTGSFPAGFPNAWKAMDRHLARLRDGHDDAGRRQLRPRAAAQGGDRRGHHGRAGQRHRLVTRELQYDHRY